MGEIERLKKQIGGEGSLGQRRAGQKVLKRSQLQQILQILVTKEANNQTLGGATDAELLKASRGLGINYLDKMQAEKRKGGGGRGGPVRSPPEKMTKNEDRAPL